MALSIGIIGMPNSGKTALFTAMTRGEAEATSYAFSTVEANTGIVPVPDDRLQALADIVNPKKIVDATVEFVDIAGLVKGASTGAGLGNQFLANIRDADALVEVIRYFEDENVMHVDGVIDPESDAETIKLELIFADMGTVERVVDRLEKESKKDKSLAPKLELVKRVGAHLENGERALTMEMTDEERALLHDLHLLTMKPVLYVANVDEDRILDSVDAIDGITPIPICARVEYDLASLEPEEAAEFLAELGVEQTGLHRLIQAAYRLLGLQSYFTAGEPEVRAWTIPIGAKAPQAASVIHTDFERGFIKAEVIGYDDYVELKGEKGAREAGKMRLEGKDYVVKDGDVVHFRFNV